MKDDILPYLEWEVLREPITIPKVDDIRELPEGAKKIVIKRDEQYKLQTILSTKGDSKFFIKETKKVVPGGFIEPFKITASDQHGFEHYTLESCYLLGGRTIQESEKEYLTEANIYTQELKIRRKTEMEGVWLTEWYINGPHDNFVFCNSTMRKMSKTFFRERSTPKDEKVHSIEISGGLSESRSYDYLRIKACDNQFLVTHVPKGIGPDWSSNIGIEYRKDWGRIPDVEEREKIRELCSFIFGHQLLLVGYTIYDKEGHMVEGLVCNPWGGDPKSLCSKPDNTPVRIDASSSKGKAEDLINQLLPPYYKIRDTLHLKDALWFYWIARNMPLEVNLPLFAAAVEAIMNGWFKHNKSRSRGVYMDKDKFEELLHDTMVIIERKLESEKYGDKVMKRLHDAYRMGVMDRFKIFFEEINLVVDENEWEAIKARHSPAHGRISSSPEEWKRVIQYTGTYETLIHKIMLKLLEYSGDYIGRSVTGWEDKQLV